MLGEAGANLDESEELCVAVGDRREAGDELVGDRPLVVPPPDEPVLGAACFRSGAGRSAAGLWAIAGGDPSGAARLV